MKTKAPQLDHKLGYQLRDLGLTSTQVGRAFGLTPERASYYMHHAKGCQSRGKRMDASKIEQIRTLASKGHTVLAIACMVGVSIPTVRNHLLSNC